MCYCVETLANSKSTTLQMTRGHSSSGPDKQDRLTHHPSHDLNPKSRSTTDRFRHRRGKALQGSHRLSAFPRRAQSHITTHVLPRGYVSELAADHPTNDPRPFFKWTRQTRSFNTPPFARFEFKVSLHNRPIPPQKRQSPAREPQFKCLPRMSTSHITTHVLLRGAVSKLEVDHPTNDPRPFFKWTRQTDRLTHHPSHDLNLQSRCTIHRFGQRRGKALQGSHKLSAFPRGAQAISQLMCYCVETLANSKPTTLQMTRGHSSGGPDKQDRLTHHTSHDLNLRSRCTIDRFSHRRGKALQGSHRLSAFPG